LEDSEVLQESTAATAEIAAAFERFMRGFQDSVAAQFCTGVEVVGTSSASCSRTTALGAVQDAFAVSLDMSPVGGTAHLVLGGRFAGWAADLLMGAPLAFAGQSREALTQLDRQALEGFVDTVIDELRTAWKGLGEVEFRRRSGRAGEASGEPDANETVVMLSADLTFGENSDVLRLIVPEARANGPAAAPNGSKQKLMEALSCASVEIQAVLRGSDLRFRDLARLRPGMVLALPLKAGPIDCQINGVTRFRGEMIRTAAGAALLVQARASTALTGRDTASE
jgi:flagellar motor switch protein FliM